MWGKPLFIVCTVKLILSKKKLVFFNDFSWLGFLGQQPVEKTWTFEPTGGKLKWGTIIPLIGGSSIGCSQSAGNLPAFHLTYTPFKDNEAHLERYWPKVPKYYIDKDQEPEDMTGKKINPKRPGLFAQLNTQLDSAALIRKHTK